MCKRKNRESIELYKLKGKKEEKCKGKKKMMTERRF
jgi:hypothetical protein